MHKKHEELKEEEEDKGLLDLLGNSSNGSFNINDDADNISNGDKVIADYVINMCEKEKTNPALGKGQSGSVIVKLIHKETKKEVAMKEISKKGKSTKQIDQIRHLINMY